MKLRFLTRILLSLPFVFLLTSSAKAQNALPQLFEGTIKYNLNYTDLNGNNINRKMSAFFDMEQTMFVDGLNFKIVNKSNEHIKLFQGKHNAYFFFNRDNTAYKIDQTSKTTQRVRVYDVADVDTILGYPCKAVKVDADFRAYIYFYNPDIKIDINPYQHYNMEEWNVYLKASEGALPLRVITIDIRSKFIEDRVAVNVDKRKLTVSDFDFPKSVKLKNLKYGLDLIW